MSERKSLNNLKALARTAKASREAFEATPNSETAVEMQRANRAHRKARAATLVLIKS